MATSGSTNYTVNRNRMIVMATSAAGVGDPGQTLSSAKYALISDLLNMMLKSMQADGLKLWLRKQATVFLKDGTKQYSLSSTGAHATYSYTKTAIKVAAVATDTIIDVDSTTGMTAGDFVGFVLDDGTSYWTTVTSVTDSDTLVIPSPGITSAAAISNNVYFFTTKIGRPLRILQAFIRDNNGNDTPVEIISQNDYMGLSSKDAEGQVNQINYDPQTGSGLLNVWPKTDDVTDTLELIVQREIEDMDAGTDDFDIPTEWYETVLYGLTERIGIQFQIPEKMMKRITAKARESLSKSMGFDVENTSMFISPEIR